MLYGWRCLCVVPVCVHVVFIVFVYGVCDSSYEVVRVLVVVVVLCVCVCCVCVLCLKYARVLCELVCDVVWYAFCLFVFVCVCGSVLFKVFVCLFVIYRVMVYGSIVLICFACLCLCVYVFVCVFMCGCCFWYFV